MNIISRIKKTKLQKSFLIKTFIVLIVSISLFTYCIYTNYIFNALFVCIFAYYAIRLLFLEYYE